MSELNSETQQEAVLMAFELSVTKPELQAWKDFISHLTQQELAIVTDEFLFWLHQREKNRQSLDSLLSMFAAERDGLVELIGKFDEANGRLKPHSDQLKKAMLDPQSLSEETGAASDDQLEELFQAATIYQLEAYKMQIMQMDTMSEEQKADAIDFVLEIQQQKHVFVTENDRQICDDVDLCVALSSVHEVENF